MIRKLALIGRKKWFVLFVVASYLLLTMYYMAPSIAHCTTIVQGTGDSTGGPIWRLTIQPNSLLGSYEHYTNYPYGETLASPVNASTALQSGVLWSFSKLAGPVCGYNLMNIGGYLVSALVMFGFIYSLTRRRWIAWLCGYAFAFTPYFQAKVGTHPGYGYEALLVGVVWAFFSLIQRPRYKTAATLTFLVASCFYWDPYFSLLIATAFGPLVGVWLGWRLGGPIFKKWSTPSSNKDIKFVLLSLGLILLTLLPLMYIKVVDSAQINAQVSASRGSSLAEAKLCSILPQEYLLPFPFNPFFLKLSGGHIQTIKGYLYKFSTCGLAEDGVGISLIMIAVIVIGAIVLTWEQLNSRKTNLKKLLTYQPSLLILGLGLGGLSAALLALPPIRIFGYPVPSYVLLELTSTWRVLSREYVVVNLVVTILFAILLTFFAHNFRQRSRLLAAMFCVLFVGIFVQYQAFPILQGNSQASFNYNTVPQAYQWVKNNKSITAIAEYPMTPPVQSSDGVYYQTMQAVHKKPLLNTALSTDPNLNLHAAIRNVADPQTIPILHSLGVSTVIIHGVSSSEISKIPYLKVIYTDTAANPETLISTNILVIAQIVDAPIVTNMLQFNSSLPVNATIETSAVHWEYEVPTGTSLVVASVGSKEANSSPFKACFNIKMAGVGDTGNLKLNIDNNAMQVVPLDDTYTEVDTFATKSLVLNASNGHNMRIISLGCPSS